MTRATALPDCEYMLSVYRSENWIFGLSIVSLPMANVRKGATHESVGSLSGRPGCTLRRRPGVADFTPALSACSRVNIDDGEPESRIAGIARSFIFTVNAIFGPSADERF